MLRHSRLLRCFLYNYHEKFATFDFTSSRIAIHPHVWIYTDDCGAFSPICDVLPASYKQKLVKYTFIGADNQSRSHAQICSSMMDGALAYRQLIFNVNLSELFVGHISKFLLIPHSTASSEVHSLLRTKVLMPIDLLPLAITHYHRRKPTRSIQRIGTKVESDILVNRVFGDIETTENLASHEY